MKILPLIVLALACQCASAQLYETPETRKRAAEAQRKLEAAKREEQGTQASGPSLQDKEAEAMAFVGKAYVYVPDPSSRERMLFYDRVPPSSYSQDPEFLLTPLSTTSFVVTGVAMPPPLVYPLGKDEFLLKIRFGDGKEAFVNYSGPFGLRSHTKGAGGEALGEYVKENPSNEPPEVIMAREAAARESAARELQVAREKTEREQRTAELKAMQEKERIAAQGKREEKARRDAVAAQRAKPSPRIGMTQSQVVSGTNWGPPNDINRTITAGGTREQWVYGNRRYLYFDNGTLTAIQD